jgi:blaI/mecI/copY family transcriptional regulator
VLKIELSKGELIVMEMLWGGECLDENGEIQALALSKLLFEKYGLGKTSCYTFFGRLVEKGAITRRYPKYTLKPIISREEALKKQQEEAIETLFQGSIINVCRAFLSERKVSREELQEMKELIDSFDLEEE